MRISERISDRYEVIREIGRGAQARTYLAIDHEHGEKVALKELDLRRAEDWKAIELFEREGSVLGSLEHPGIPHYIDAFRVEDDSGELHFYLAQEFVPGTSLQERIEAGERLNEAQARVMLDGILDILGYLHSLSPPVVHRDIKPANIMMRPDGSYALIDFGAVQEIVQNALGGDTVVGTSGFLPPEQSMGRAQPASDLYALGATVLYAMSGVDPVDFPVVGLRLDFSAQIDSSPRFEDFLERMLAPVVEDRLPDSKVARAHLDALSEREIKDLARSADSLPVLQEESLEDGLVRYHREGERLTLYFKARRSLYMPLVFVGPLFLYSILSARILGVPRHGSLPWLLSHLFSSHLFSSRFISSSQR